jgi:hypothetical protein
MMNLREILIMRKQFRQKDAELKKEKQKIAELTDEVLRLNGAVCTAMAQLSKEDMARFNKIVEKECEAFALKMGSKLWTS